MQKSILPKYLIAVALGLALSTAAQAQLQITGINAFFSNALPVGSATVTNNGYNSVNTLTSPPSPGQSVVITSTPTALASPSLLLNVVNPVGFVQLDSFSIDKQNVSGSGVTTSYNFTEQLEFNGDATTDLTLNYAVTTVSTTNTTYTYAISPSFQTGSFLVGSTLYTYTAIGDGFSGTVGTGGSASNGDVHFNFQAVLAPVPEASTYGLMGALSLAGFAAYRRFRGILGLA